jgi:quercetin dioxygenase-like cupin family protein
VTGTGGVGDLVERIEDDKGKLLSMILRSGTGAPETTFVTTPEANLQVGLVVYDAGGEVKRHTHRPLERTIIGTSEVLLVRSGRCVLDLYDEEHNLVAEQELSTGDVILLIAGGHGFRMLEDTVLLEVKQGPYTGLEEKERF